MPSNNKDENKKKKANETKAQKIEELKNDKENDNKINNKKENNDKIKKNNNQNNKEENDKEQNNKKENNNKKNKALKIIEIIVLVMCIICLIVYIAITTYINKKISKIQINSITNDTNELGINNQNMTNQMSKYRNIAILGIDSQYEGYDTDFRTDCIMVASINTENNDVQLYSIYRDTYVEIEENEEKKLDKINHAYYGGVENTLKAINTNLDLNITEYVMANFNAIADLVDAVDGVDIYVDNNELKYINGYIQNVSKITGKKADNITETGLHKLNGVQAVSYCRIRYTEGGDYKRTERMREVLQKVIIKIKELNLVEINNLLDTILPEIRTNISANEIKSMIPKVISFYMNPTFGWPYTTEGVWMRNDFFGPAATLESNVKKLHEEVYGQTDYVVPDKIKKISDKIIEETKVTEK